MNKRGEMKDLKSYMNDRRGLSAIVVTLIMILLMLVAVGIVWVVVRNIIESGTGQIDLSTRCLELGITAIALVNTSLTDYDLTLNRSPTGGDIGGVKVVMFNDTENSGVLDFGAALVPLETTSENISAGIINVNKVEITPYFTDDSGNDQLCTIISPFDF